MSDHDEDDKPTVVLDLNALKKQKAEEEAQLANIVDELEFNVHDTPATQSKPAARPPRPTPKFKVMLFDFTADFFEKAKPHMPAGYDYQVAKALPQLNDFLKAKEFQVVVFNYDQNPKAVNQLSAQIKQKFPHTKVLIMARAISPEKAKMHAATPAGASGYFQLPLDSGKLEQEFQRIYSQEKKAS